MFKHFLVLVSGLVMLAVLAGLTLEAIAEEPPRGPEYAQTAALPEPARPSGDVGYNQVIPPADFWEVRERAKDRRARAALNQARVQAVIDYIKAHNRFPPRALPFDAAQQVVIDYIRVNNRVPTSADQVDSPVQAVLDYIRVHHAMPPHPEPVDPAIQAVMDYIRVYGKVPTSAGSVQ